MQIYTLKAGQDLSALTQQLQVKGGAQAVALLKTLNPHLDLTRLKAGSVVLVPSATDSTESVAGAVFDALADDVRQGLKAASARVKAGQARADDNRKAVAAAVKSVAFKKVLQGDTEMARQVAAADAAAKSSAAQAKQAEQTLAGLASMLDEELGTLGKLMR